MTSRTLRLSIAALLLSCVAQAASAQAATRAWLDRDRVELGETVTLNVETGQATARAPDFSALEPDFVVSDHSSSRSVELVNGERRARVLFAVALKPRREGLVTVPALQVGGESTAPLPLTVVPASTAPARAGELVFIEGEADSQDPYVQQSIGYVLRLYYAVPLISGQLDQPEPEGASMRRVGSDLQFTREIDGRRYTVVERRYVIVPERSGTLTIPGARFEGRGVGGFFDEMLGDGRRDLRANGAPRILQVRPMPDGAPQPWLPLHGLELRWLETPQSLRAGEAANVVVEMSADGAAASQLPELRLPPIDGAQVFPEPAQVDETFERGRLRTKVTRRFAIVPAQPGALRVPGPRQAWWDVRASTARTASLPDLNLTVAEAAAGTGVSAERGTVAASDGSRSPPWLPGGGWPWLAIAFALLWLGTLAWAFRVRRTARPRVVANAEPDASATTAPMTSLRELQRVLQVGDLGEVERALCGLVSPPAPDLDALQRHLVDDGQRAAVARLQHARWHDGDPAGARAALREAFAGGARWRAAAASDAVSTLLPPLYPGRRES